MTPFHIPMYAVYEILLAAGCIISSIAVFLSIRKTRLRLEARQKLVRKLVQDVEFLAELKRFHASKAIDPRYLEELEELHALIQHRLRALSRAERSRVEASLFQPSRIGRGRYVRKLADDVTQLQHSEV